VTENAVDVAFNTTPTEQYTTMANGRITNHVHDTAKKNKTQTASESRILEEK
jgi:hypothetical protein